MKPPLHFDLNDPLQRAAYETFKRDGMAPKASVTPLPITPPEPKQKRAKGMNLTEQRWRAILEAQVRRGDIREFAYEPFAMRLAERTSYQPDFVSILPHTGIKIHELTELFTKSAAEVVGDEQLTDLVELLTSAPDPVIRIDECKGAMIWPKNRIKWKMARELYPWIEFRMWQWKRSEWTQLL